MNSTTEENVNFDFTYNFNPDDVEVEDTINAVFAIDVSMSVKSYSDELNGGLNQIVQELQKSHVANKIFISIVEFNHNVSVRTGFQPISQIPVIDFTSSINGTTALYDGTKIALENALSYREGLENAGVNCKTLLFVITDGEDNASNSRPSDVKNIISNLLVEERNFASFESILFGVGKGENDNYFNQAASEMGITNVATIGNSPGEIRKMISFISSSISSASTGGQAISTPNF